jgi:hypothetical protein
MVIDPDGASAARGADPMVERGLDTRPRAFDALDSS